MFDYFYGQSGEMFVFRGAQNFLPGHKIQGSCPLMPKRCTASLLDRMGPSAKNGWLDEQGRVYIIFPVQEVMVHWAAQNKATKLFGIGKVWTD